MQNPILIKIDAQRNLYLQETVRGDVEIALQKCNDRPDESRVVATIPKSERGKVAEFLAL